MANLLNGLLQDGSLHVLVQLHLLFLLVHIRVDPCVLHFIGGCGTRRVLGNLLYDFKHSLKRVKYKPVGSLTDVNGCNSQDTDDPDGPCQVYNRLSLAFLLDTIDNTELNAVFSDA